MKHTDVLTKAFAEVPADIRLQGKLSFGIADRIADVLNQNGMTQKELARKMGKTEAEVSVWLSGQQNFTLRTLAKISIVLGVELIQISG